MLKRVLLLLFWGWACNPHAAKWTQSPGRESQGHLLLLPDFKKISHNFNTIFCKEQEVHNKLQQIWAFFAHLSHLSHILTQIDNLTLVNHKLIADWLHPDAPKSLWRQPVTYELSLTLKQPLQQTCFTS